MSPLRGRRGKMKRGAGIGGGHPVNVVPIASTRRREDERKVGTRDYPFIDPASIPRMKKRPSRT